MERLGGGLYALGCAAAAAMLASCGGSQLPVAVPLASSPTTDMVMPACTGTRVGRAQCDALVEVRPVTPDSGDWTAAQLEAAYDLPSTSKGAGQTVYVVDAYDNPNVKSDFAVYRSAMGLPSGTLRKYNQSGQQSDYPTANKGWGVEIDLDVEMASASCPKCTVALVEADSSSWSDIEAAETEAVRLGGKVVSNSYSGTGASSSYYDTPGVTYLASAGDKGSGLYDPATYDDVVAVGGTVLSTARNTRGYSETTWSHSGGGCSSTGSKKPSWQLGSPYAKSCSYRMGNDVSAVAEGAIVYDSYAYGGWIAVDGTSVSSPFCAGIFGLAANATKQEGGRTFWTPASHHAHLYEVGARFSARGGWGSPHGIVAF